jgi:hypothetical protein
MGGVARRLNSEDSQADVRVPLSGLAMGRAPESMPHVPGTISPAARRVVIWTALAASLVGSGVATASAADAPLLYLREDAAAAVDQGLGGGTLRQAPAVPHPRWSVARTVGKVAGRELAGQGAARIAAILRAGWAEAGVGGLVSVDEITPRQWSPGAAAQLAAALERLGGNASRVIFYAAPSFVEQVGRTDPRRPLAAHLAALVDAMSRGRATYLLTYRGDMSPMPPREMATHPTRWAARWPAGRGELRLMLGADGGLGQAELWARVRATPAGRELLARGPAAYGLATAAAGRAWVEQYRAFRGAPTVSATGGDFPVPAPGGLTLTKVGARRVKVVLGRAGNAVVTMTPRGGGKVRAIRKLVGPSAGVVVRLPTDSRPGAYRIQAILIGDGLRDRVSITMRVKR